MVKDKINTIITETVKEENLFLVDLELHGTERNLKIYVYVDTMSGVTIAECERVTRKILERLEDAELRNVNYSLEVSSPGLDRPLKFPWQYRKNIGRQLRVIYEMDGSQRTVEGELADFNEENLRIKTKKEDLEIPFKNIIKSRVLITW